MFLWIAFNAAYGGERSTFGARDDFETFFLNLERLDTDKRLYGIVWSSFPGPIRIFLETRYVFAPFWRFQHGDTEAEDWAARFDAARRRFHQALKAGETVMILSMLFDRLYVLRNQLMHGGATWNSGTNRDQLRDGAEILRNVVPVPHIRGADIGRQSHHTEPCCGGLLQGGHVITVHSYGIRDRGGAFTGPLQRPGAAPGAPAKRKTGLAIEVGCSIAPGC